jgi:hypothetical protein
LLSIALCSCIKTELKIRKSTLAYHVNKLFIRKDLVSWSDFCISLSVSIKMLDSTFCSQKKCDLVSLKPFEAQDVQKNKKIRPVLTDGVAQNLTQHSHKIFETGCEPS